MEAQVKTRVTINASPSDVFVYMKELRLHYLWNPHVQSLTPPQTLKKGAKYTAVSYIFGHKLENANTVINFKPDELLEIENVTGMVRYRVSYVLEPKNEHTIVTCDIEVAADGDAFAFAKPVLKLMARRELQADLQALKVAVEEQLQ